ncbi:MAG: peptidylprolyl isomerase [Phycisphaeraceae bacterium]|nr:peptidylprolyl isomerase [Phycisphaeraceae bacterium]
MQDNPRMHSHAASVATLLLLTVTSTRADDSTAVAPKPVRAIAPHSAPLPAPEGPPPLPELLPSMRSERTWVKPEGPIWIEVTRPPNTPPLDLVLMAPSGTVLASTPIDAGRYDALAMLPPIHALERAAWLQLLSGGHPTGTPLVVVPLRTPPPCRTVEAKRPDGVTRFTRIIGWGSEPLDPNDPAAAALRSSWIEGDSPITSGFRVYPDRDAIMRTEFGPILFAFAPDAAPATVWNFLTLVEAGFYDQTVMHRVVPRDREGRPFVVQGGDPTTTGDGGPGFNLALEPSDLPHDFGVLSMARGDEPHSAGSQFFIALSREGTARLDGQYCAFGYAVGGREPILRMSEVPIDDPRTGRPKDPPRVERIELVPAPARMPGVDRRDLRLPREPPPGPPPANPER